jgi:hypothetical protein
MSRGVILGLAIAAGLCVPAAPVVVAPSRPADVVLPGDP